MYSVVINVHRHYILEYSLRVSKLLHNLDVGINTSANVEETYEKKNSLKSCKGTVRDRTEES